MNEAGLKRRPKPERTNHSQPSNQSRYASINSTCARPSRSFSQMQRWFTENAAGATELIDDADKRSDNDKYLDRRYRRPHAYDALDHLLTMALDKSATLQSRLADYHKASPELAHWLARWQAEDVEG